MPKGHRPWFPTGPPSWDKSRPTFPATLTCSAVTSMRREMPWGEAGREIARVLTSAA